MENLTDRQVELIEDLLVTYSRLYDRINKEQLKRLSAVQFIFNGVTYNIWELDYENVCEIIDYIKGVKKNGNS